jgi:predicted kinase
MSAPKIIPNKPFVIFLYGFPGSGKTAFARQLAEEVSVAHLQQDRLSQELYGENTDQTDKLSKNAMNYMSREFLRAGVSVIFDTDVHRLGERRMLRDAARQTKATPVLIWLQIDPETAYMRGQKRDRRKADDHFAKDYTPESYEAVLNRMQNPDHEDYIVISGKHTFHTQRAAVFKKFYELGILTPAQLSQNIAKPGLVNLIPQTQNNHLGGRTDITRRNINIR